MTTKRMEDERLRNICEQEPGLDAEDAEEVLQELDRARQSETELRKMLQRLCDAIGAEPSENMTPEQTATFAVYMEAAQMLERSES